MGCGQRLTAKSIGSRLDSAARTSRTYQAHHGTQCGSRDGRQRAQGSPEAIGVRNQKQRRWDEQQPRRFAEHQQARQQANQDQRAGASARRCLPESQRQQPRREHQAHQQRLQDRETAEGIEERAGCQKRDRRERDPTRRLRPQHGIAEQQIRAEDGDDEDARRGHADASEAKYPGQQQRPHGQRHRGVEVAAPKPMPAEKKAGGRAAVPAFIRVLGIVHPRGIVGEIGERVHEVQADKHENAHGPQSVQTGRSVRTQTPLLSHTGTCAAATVAPFIFSERCNAVYKAAAQAPAQRIGRGERPSHKKKIPLPLRGSGIFKQLYWTCATTPMV